MGRPEEDVQQAAPLPLRPPPLLPLLACHGDICPWLKLAPALHMERMRERAWSFVLGIEGGHHKDLMDWNFLSQHSWLGCMLVHRWRGWLRVRPSVSLCKRSPCRESLLYLSDQLPSAPLKDPELVSDSVFLPQVSLFLCEGCKELEICPTGNRLRTPVRALAQMQATEQPLENK